MGLWELCDRQVAEFVLSHIGDIIEHAFQLPVPGDKAVTHNCIRILATSSPRARHLLSSNAHLVNFLLSSIAQLHKFVATTQATFFYILSGLVFDAQWTIAPLFAHDEFFAAFLRYLEVDGAFTIMQSIVMTAPKPVMPFMRRIGFCGLLLDNVLAGAAAQRSGQLFLLALVKQSAIDVPGYLLENDRLTSLLASTIGGGHATEIDFVRSLFDWAAQYTFATGWRRVRAMIASSVADLCRFVIERETFTRPCEAAVRLVVAIIGKRPRIDTEVRCLVIRLSEMFFAFPHNTFLHTQFVEVMRVVVSSRPAPANLLAEMRLFATITECCRERDENFVSCYWGHLMRLADVLDPLAEKGGADVPKWRAAVIARKVQQQEVIARSYGGAKQGAAPGKANRTFVVIAAACVVLLVALLMVAAPRWAGK
jgi:hypothetical protein